ncbi:MAG: hypothetical protein U0103_01040 [Candidatus Obscuribacterales bacterium]
MRSAVPRTYKLESAGSRSPVGSLFIEVAVSQVFVRHVHGRYEKNTADAYGVAGGAAKQINIKGNWFSEGIQTSREER